MTEQFTPIGLRWVSKTSQVIQGGDTFWWFTKNKQQQVVHGQAASLDEAKEAIRQALVA